MIRSASIQPVCSFATVMVVAVTSIASPPDPADCCTGLPRGATRVQAASPLPESSTSGAKHIDQVKESPAGMVWIPGGPFDMGSTDPLSRPDESPVHRVCVDGFWMDLTEVTNAQFSAFIAATNYKTVAERPLDWEQMKKQAPPGTPEPAPDELLPGSLVFAPPGHPVVLRHHSQWWRWVDGANWRHPEGPISTVAGRDAHPVVHIAFEDAQAYCTWARKRLPTEAEWEFAARGGLEGKVNVWGDEPIDSSRANIWQGEFPLRNTSEDGHLGTAPVKSFAPNGYGLYDMAGNVWEWCSDLYRPDTYARRVATLKRNGIAANPRGPERSFDPRNPYEPELHVMRSGSFLCHDSYCASYRPSARMASSPDTSLSHTGFRCVADGPAPGADTTVTRCDEKESEE